jgi:putative glutamine amidotransferase
MKRTLLLVAVCFVVLGGGCHYGQGPHRPLIGITSVYHISEDGKSARTQVDFAYVSAVADNGGVPVVLPAVNDDNVLQRYLNVLDGLVLIGGDDIPPSAYGQEPNETVEPLPAQRYNFERKLIARWWAGGKPLLGVCLGMQFTNVVAGGTLIQDIPSQIGTEVDHRAVHRVRIEPGSKLAKTLGRTQADVYSNHHQAVKDVGKGLKAVAHSDDGIIEAMERIKGGFGLFVQWHPEQMSDKAHRDAIYGALVRAATLSR